MAKQYFMLALRAKAIDLQREIFAAWREVLFWMLLLPAVAALDSSGPRRQAAGILEACGFLLVAYSSLGKLKKVGLNFVAWERITSLSVVRCLSWGLAAGAGAVLLSKLSHEPILVSPFWNKAVLIVLVGPAIEEIVFRGYLLTLLLHVLRAAPLKLGHLVAVLTAALIFAAAHGGNPGMTWLQLGCVTAMGCVYGWLRLRTGSTAAAFVAHSTYNLMLCLSSWLGT